MLISEHKGMGDKMNNVIIFVLEDFIAKDQQKAENNTCTKNNQHKKKLIRTFMQHSQQQTILICMYMPNFVYKLAQTEQNYQLFSLDLCT